MVILITGASHTGKTVLAQKLLEKHHYPYISIDHLKMGLIRSGNTDLTPEDDDKLTDYLWRIAREMVKTAVENDQNLIVEGCYIPFNWRKDLDEEYLKYIRFICLALTEEYIDSNFEVIKDHASAVEKRVDDTYVTPEWIKAENLKYINGFESAGENVILIDKDYSSAIDKLSH